MLSTFRSGKPRSVFVICEAGSDISPLIEILRNLGLDILNAEDAFGPSTFIVGSTQQLITKADVVCAFLRDENSPNVYLELGYALGLPRPVVIISPSSTLPLGLADQFTINATLDDHPALTFQIQAFLANLGRQKSGGRKPTASSGVRSKSSAKLISSEVPQSEVERDLLEALQHSFEIDSIAPQPRRDDDRGYIPDFAIWLSAAPKTIESPVVIEVKGGHLGPAAIDRAVDQIRTYAQAGDVRTGLIVIKSRRHRGPRVMSLAPLIFVFGLEEIRELLASGRLVETLRRERNRFAHSAG